MSPSSGLLFVAPWNLVLGENHVIGHDDLNRLEFGMDPIVYRRGVRQFLSFQCLSSAWLAGTSTPPPQAGENKRFLSCLWFQRYPLPGSNCPFHGQHCSSWSLTSGCKAVLPVWVQRSVVTVAVAVKMLCAELGRSQWPPHAEDSVGIPKWPANALLKDF